MIANRIALASGKYVTEERAGCYVLQPDGWAVRMSTVGQRVTLTDPETEKVVHESEIADGAQRKKPTNRAQKTTPPIAGRWSTLNEFVDVISPVITKTESLVWVLLFRHARGAVVETSERQIATALQLKKFSAGRALRGLVSAGLIWPIHKSNTKAASSKYGIHPKPSECLARIMDGAKKTNRSEQAPA